MTPFDLLLGGDGPLVLLGAIVLTALLTLLAAGLEIVLERAGGADPAALPDWFARHGPTVFVYAGVPAIVASFAGGLILTLMLGGNPARSGLWTGWPVLLDLGVLVAILACGIGSPLTQHWGLGIAVFSAGAGAIFPLLFIANALPFGESGALAYPDRVVLALTVGLILTAFISAAAGLIALGVTSARTWCSLRRLRRRGAAHLTLVEPGPG